MKFKKNPLSEHSPSELQDAITRIKNLEKDIASSIREMQIKAEQMELLMEVSSLLNSTLNPEIVREKALEATCKLLGCETASLLLVDPDSFELYWDVGLGETGKQLKKNLRLPINQSSIAGTVALTGESLMLNDVAQDPRHFRKATEKTGFVVKTMLCVPLQAKDKIIGVLQAINKLETLPRRPSMHSWSDFQEEDLKLLRTLSHQVTIAIENSRLYTFLKKSFYDTVEALAESIEKKDHYTGGHTKRVLHFSLCIAKYLNLTLDQLEKLRLSALLHDIGKIGVDDKILKKEAPLDPEEWKFMKQHPEFGYQIMKKVEGLKDVIGGMRYHHERWDGLGYPLGLKGEDIPLAARIIAVADTYDAMVSSRPYRKGLPASQAYDEVLKYSGTQFDPTVVKAFKQAFENEKMGQGNRGSTLSNCD